MTRHLSGNKMEGTQMHGEEGRKAILKPLLTTLLDGATTRISRISRSVGLSVGRSAMSDFQFASNNTCPNKVHLSSTSVNGAEQQVPNRPLPFLVLVLLLFSLLFFSGCPPQ